MDRFEEKIRAWKQDQEVPEKVWDQYTETLASLPEKKGRRKAGFSFRAAAAAVCVLALSGTGVYAAGRYFGILDFAGRIQEEIPKEAEELIDRNVGVADETETDDSILNCTVLEALCDSETIILTVEVSAKEAGNYLFIPEDALPEDSMASWSTLSDQTAREYAQEKGLTLVSIGGGIQNRDELGIAEATMDFQSTAEDVIDLYIRCGKTEDGDTLEVDFTATARYTEAENSAGETGASAGRSAVMRKNMKLTLQDRSETVTVTYLPETVSYGSDTADAGSGYEVEKAELIQTDLGTYIDVYYTNENGEDPENELIFEAADEGGTRYTCLGGTGRETEADGSYKERIRLNKTQIGERFLLIAYDYREEKEYGQTVMGLVE